MQFLSDIKAFSMRLTDLRDRNVAIIGAGREAASVIRALAKHAPSANVRVLDEKAQPDATIEGIVVERFSGDKLEEADFIIKSPGVSPYRPELQGRTNITSATNLWFAEQHAPVIAITGTKGKSTTSSLVTHLLNGIGIDARIAGNIGQNPIDLIDEAEPDFWVLELSSYQTYDLQGSPDIAVMTSFSPEHLDWHGDVATYFRDKSRLLELGKKRVINPVGREMQQLLQRFPDAATPDATWQPPPSQLHGEHNTQLIRLAWATLETAGIDTGAKPGELATALQTFEPLPHRLQPVAEVNGVLYVNDSLSTTPLATQAAIEAFRGRVRTVLVGGYDRGLPFGEFGQFIRAQTNVQLVTMPDCGDRIAAEVNKPDIVTRANSLEEAVNIATANTPPGGVVLLSPAATSFDHFRDYADRGQQFVELVQKIVPRT
jgi:UDP-N-acetylmuramoylalanine-D-glutamate ligase